MKISAVVLFAVIFACDAQDCPIVCPAVFSPVCGSDGGTYPNACYLGLQACLLDDSTLTEVSCNEKRRAATDCSDISCISQYAPVCGSDGVTYSNPCHFGIAQCNTPSLTITGTGQCN